jgi:pimeloyl-ACP methyl ester carboxylesterase
MNGLLDHVSVNDSAFDSFDYGAPVGYRVTLRHPVRVTAVVVLLVVLFA